MATKKPGRNSNGKMIEGYGVDNASSIPLNDKESREGRKMGGSTSNLAHSLKGSSAVQEVTRGKK